MKLLTIIKIKPKHLKKMSKNGINFKEVINNE